MATIVEPRRLFVEAHDTFEEGATFVIRKDGGLTVSVAEEKAVDSYNHSFQCRCKFSREEAIILRDWLNKAFPRP